MSLILIIPWPLIRYDDKTKVINSPDSNDSGIQADVHHIHGPINDDIYATVQKRGHSSKDSQPDQVSCFSYG